MKHQSFPRLRYRVAEGIGQLSLSAHQRTPIRGFQPSKYSRI